MIHLDPLVLILRLTFLLLIATSFLVCALALFAVLALGMDQVWGLYGFGCMATLIGCAVYIDYALSADGEVA